MKLLQQNFMQARISPSMAADQQLLQNKVFLEQNLKQQVCYYYDHHLNGLLLEHWTSS